MTKLWQKKDVTMHPAVNTYIISENLSQDTLLVPYDIEASKAHATMLCSVGLINETEQSELVSTLDEILEKYNNGDFNLDQQNEDCHTCIEKYLTEKLGNTGKKIHMGRSRNDQVLVAMRLLIKDKLEETIQKTKQLAHTLIDYAKKHEFIPMPGYTHTQQAMPSSVGQWTGSFIESLIDDISSLEHAHALCNQNPLGSAAGFGTALPLDRDETTKILEFKRPQINSIYCQNSRGKLEAAVIGALVQVMMTLGKIASDAVMYTTAEFDFFEVDRSLTTGSSIMPQKQNLDIMEVLRANVSIIMSYQMQTQMVTQNLTSGYHKDLKITKQPTIESFKITQSSLDIVKLLFENMKPNVEKLKKAFTTEIFATDVVNDMVQKGTPFRDAYKYIGENLDTVEMPDIDENIRGKKHLGATGNLGIERYEQML
jgi:argininosuccinate lyase